MASRWCGKCLNYHLFDEGDCPSSCDVEEENIEAMLERFRESEGLQFELSLNETEPIVAVPDEEC